MTMADRFSRALRGGPTPMCDDCVSEVARCANRQSANLTGSRMAREYQIIRGKGECARCGRYKIVSRFSIGAPEATVSNWTNAQATLPADPSPDDRPWHWEGHIESVLATYLAGQGYRLRQVIDTASKTTGVDIIAERDGQTLWVTVKGYPTGTARTNAGTQSRHWFSHAMFDVARYRTERADIAIGVGLPDGFTSYLNLAPKIAWLKESVPFRFYWVSADGTVREQ